MASRVFRLPCSSSLQSSHRSLLFSEELRRQQAQVARVEKIRVRLNRKGPDGPETKTLLMNRGVSTPYNCAMHISEWLSKRSVVALVDDRPYHMLRPLHADCSLSLLNFVGERLEEVNKAYWRSCAFILGAVLESAFKDEFAVTLLRAPDVPVISGAFCYDVILDQKLDNWKPSEAQFQALTRRAFALLGKNLPYEHLSLHPNLALQMFQENRYKQEQIEEIASQQEEVTVYRYIVCPCIYMLMHICVLYIHIHNRCNPSLLNTSPHFLSRLGDFVDLSEGPLIPYSSLCFQFAITAAHPLKGKDSASEASAFPAGYDFHRFQGLSLPVYQRAHHVIWHKLVKRATRLVLESSGNSDQATQPQSSDSPSTPVLPSPP
uniref:Mitochondrial ribosomal protein L39 n=1 Tax=Eptatretus burgeri TaxID=7764 RepID=A0A8C4NB68_EPTBU